MSGNNDSRRSDELSSKTVVASRHRAGESSSSSSSPSSSSSLRSRSSSAAVAVVDAQHLSSAAFGNGTANNNHHQHHRIPLRSTKSHDSSCSSTTSTTPNGGGGFNSFLRWFRKSPVPQRPHSQPPPTPPRQRLLSANAAVSEAANASETVPIPTGSSGGAETRHLLSTASLPDERTEYGGRRDSSDDASTLSAASSLSGTLSLSSLSSGRGSVYSTATDGFAFVAPDEYAPYGGAAFQPEKRIAVGPPTDTYRQRLSALQLAKEHDRRHAGDGQPPPRLGLKYNLPEDTDSASTADDLTLTRRHHLNHHHHHQRSADRASLPVAIVLPSVQQAPAATPTVRLPSPPGPPVAQPRDRRPSLHRRTFSDCSKDRRAGSYVHVRGKRRAPTPPAIATQALQLACSPAPATLSPMSTLARRNKRPAPQPPQSQPTTTLPATSPASPPPVSDVRLFNDAELEAIMTGHSDAVLAGDLSATDTLRLDNGQLRHTMSAVSPPPSVSISLSPPPPMIDAATSPLSPMAPRPWYKRSSTSLTHRESIPFKREISLKTMEKRRHKTKSSSAAAAAAAKNSAQLSDRSNYARSPPPPSSPSLFEGFFARVSTHKSAPTSPPSVGECGEKRLSAIGMPNISELDREAAEIIRMEEAAAARRLADRAAALQNDRYFDQPPPTNDEATRESSTSARALISRFEETTAVKSPSQHVDKAIIDKYFADPAARTTSATTTTTMNNVVTVASASASSSTGGAVTRNRALSPASKTTTKIPSTGKPAECFVNAAAPTTTTTSAAAATSMMQPIFSNGRGSVAAAVVTVSSPPPTTKQPTTTTSAPLQRAGATKNTTPSITSSQPTTSATIKTSTAAAAAPSMRSSTSAINSPPPATSTSTWICSHCTLENYNWRRVCEVCERMRPTPKLEARVGSDGNLKPVPRFGSRANEGDEDVLVVATAVTPKQTAAAARVIAASAANPSRLIDSSAVTVTGTPQVFVAPLPARHANNADASITQKPTTNGHQPLEPNLEEIRAARIEKFAHDIAVQSTNNVAKPLTPPPPKTTRQQTTENKPLECTAVASQSVQTVATPATLSDRGSLEREKQRLREMIREMNAKALADKYPVRARTPPPAIETAPVKSATTTPARSPQQSATPVPIPVGRGALRKQPMPRKIAESPEDKHISDTANYIFDTAVEKPTATKSSQATFVAATSPPPAGQSALNIPSPIAELCVEESFSLASSSGQSSPNTQQRLVDEQIDSIYARLRSNNSGRNKTAEAELADEAAALPVSEDSKRTIARGLDDFKAAESSAEAGGNRRRPTDTLALNRLLKDLEHAIGDGDDELAARLATDLARRKVALSVTKQQKTDGNRAEAAAAPADEKISNVAAAKTKTEATANGNGPDTDELEGATALPPPTPSTNLTKTGWICPLCTLINEPDRPGCAVCSETRPEAAATTALPPSNSTPHPQPTAQVRLRPNCNDLGKASINRRSAEIFNIAPPKAEAAEAKVSEPTSSQKTKPLPQPPVFSAMALALLAASTSQQPSPNITRTKYRGVDNYNPQVNKAVLTIAPSSSASQIQRKSNVPYKSPLARTSGTPGSGSGVKITAVTLKTGESIAVTLGKGGALAKKSQTKVTAPAAPDEPNTTPATVAAAAGSTHYTELLQLDNCSLVANSAPFECAVCLAPCARGAGCVLRECLHQFCRECLAQTVRYSEDAVEVRCPYADAAYSCEARLQEREIRGLLTREEFERHLAVQLSVAEQREKNAFHCRTPGCRGWCIYEDNVNEFRCPICRHGNCLTCRVVHDGLNCKQYQDRMNSDSDSNEEARRTSEMLAEMIEKGEAMKCPVCQVIVMKKWGCDWLKCSMCKTEICWSTRGCRWGPEGKGDTSAGCRCGVNGIKCHPKCNYCH